MLVLAGIRRKASYTIWIHRRLPGHWLAGSFPLAQAACSVALVAGNEELYLFTSSERSSKFVPFQISPSACTSGPVTSYPTSL